MMVCTMGNFAFTFALGYSIGFLTTPVIWMAWALFKRRSKK